MSFDPFDIFGQKRKLSSIQMIVLTVIFVIVIVSFVYFSTKDYSHILLLQYLAFFTLSMIIMYDTRMILTGATIKWSFIRIITVIIAYFILTTTFIISQRKMTEQEEK